MSNSPKELIARTGRVQSWIDDPTSRLPVSCTVFVVEDEMEGPNGIEASWRFVSHALRYGAGVAVHLSKIRHKGAENGKGLVASGPVSFAKIYSTLNEILRRGGVYKNGAVVCHLDLNHPDVLDFITASRSELPWVKRCVNINRPWWEATTPKVKEALLEGIKRGDIWLNKTKVDKKWKKNPG
jgi:ribonucleotide reductase alpha subunit